MSQDEDAKQEGKWYFDSGCTSHMTGNKDLLSNYREKKGPKIRFGGGVKLSSVGTGDLFLGKLKLADVLYVEGLAYNLLSQGQLTDKGYYMGSRAKTCALKDEKTDEVVMTGDRKGQGSLYRAHCSDVEVCRPWKRPEMTKLMSFDDFQITVYCGSRTVEIVPGVKKKCSDRKSVV